jgi:hypothetical protein
MARPDAGPGFVERLYEMDRALSEMEPQLPADVRSLGTQARRQVSFWLGRVAAGGADLGELSLAMVQLAELMNALTARLLLAPWSGQTQRGPKS